MVRQASCQLTSVGGQPRWPNGRNCPRSLCSRLLRRKELRINDSAIHDSAIKPPTACSHQPVRADTPRNLPERPTNIRQNYWATKSFFEGLPPPLFVSFRAILWPFPHFRSSRSPTAYRPILSNVGIATKRRKKSQKVSWTPPACSHKSARADTARNFPERLTDLWQNHGWQNHGWQNHGWQNHFLGWPCLLWLRLRRAGLSVVRFPGPCSRSSRRGECFTHNADCTHDPSTSSISPCGARDPRRRVRALPGIAWMAPAQPSHGWPFERHPHDRTRSN